MCIMAELRPEDLEELVQEMAEGSGAPDATPQRVRVCPKCGKHNLEDAWHCSECGTVLSIDTLTDEDAAESAAAMREKQREKQRAIKARENRKEPANSLVIIFVIAFGIVWVGISAASGAPKVPWLFGLIALPGAAALAIGLWSWLAASSARNVFLRSMKEAVGTVEDLDKKEHRGEYGKEYKYFVTVLFEADDANMGTRVIALKAQVAHSSWKGMKRGDTVGIRYATEDPRIALIEGEW